MVKATFPAVHFDARKSQRAGAFASAAGTDFAYRTHTGMFEGCQLHPAPARYIGVEETPARTAFFSIAVPRHSSKTMHSKAIENFQK